MCPSNSAIINLVCTCPTYSELIDFACICPENAEVVDLECTCPENSEIVGSACECIEGYGLGTDGVFVCSYIPIILTRENVVRSQEGLEIRCDGTGVATTVSTEEYRGDNDIYDAEWVWTANGNEPFDFCTVTVQFLRHSSGSVYLQFDSADDKAFYVNGVECFVDDQEFVDQEVTACFGEVGNYELVFLSEHTVLSFGMSFKVYESYLCADTCFDCVGEQCCPQDFAMQGSICYTPLSEIIPETTGETTDEPNEEEAIPEGDVTEYVPVEISDVQFQGFFENNKGYIQGISHSTLLFIIILGITGIIAAVKLSNYCLKKKIDDDVAAGEYKYRYIRIIN